VNRAVCENSAIDVLCHPELNRTDSGLDHICVKAASEKDVAIEINFREILESYKRQRVNVISFIKKNIELCKKYNTKMITVSGAVSKWGLRSPRELAANAHVLGLDLGAAIASVSVVPEQILEKNREKITGRRWEGVKLVDE
jgi:ribonuclease P/MRP protein subunit RPP1